MNQCMEALSLANTVRITIAQERRALRGLSYDEARHRVADLLDGTTEDNEWVGPCRVSHLLAAIPRMGPRKVEYLLRRMDVRNVDRKVRDLPNRQRVELADELRSAASIGVKAA